MRPFPSPSKKSNHRIGRRRSTDRISLRSGTRFTRSRVTTRSVNPRTNQSKVERKNPNMEIKRVGSQPSGKGPAEWFTGTVRVDTPFKAEEPGRMSGALVTFEPGARTNWHTHPLGQTLIATAGCGRVQNEAGPIERVR